MLFNKSLMYFDLTTLCDKTFHKPIRNLITLCVHKYAKCVCILLGRKAGHLSFGVVCTRARSRKPISWIQNGRLARILFTQFQARRFRNQHTINVVYIHKIQPFCRDSSIAQRNFSHFFRCDDAHGRAFFSFLSYFDFYVNIHVIYSESNIK